MLKDVFNLINDYLQKKGVLLRLDFYFVLFFSRFLESSCALILERMF